MKGVPIFQCIRCDRTRLKEGVYKCTNCSNYCLCKQCFLDGGDMEHNPRHVFVALLRRGQFQDFFVDRVLLDLPPYIPGRSTEDIYKMIETQRAEHPQPAGPVGSGFGFSTDEGLDFDAYAARYAKEYPQPSTFCGKGPHAGFG